MDLATATSGSPSRSASQASVAPHPAAALAWLTLRDGLPEVAVGRSIAALAGLPASAAIAIAVTLLVAAVQAAAGLWLGRALAPGHD